MKRARWTKFELYNIFVTYRLTKIMAKNILFIERLTVYMHHVYSQMEMETSWIRSDIFYFSLHHILRNKIYIDTNLII